MKYLGAHGLAPLVNLPPLGVPGGTSQRLWCRETADDNRLLTCFLDHTVPSDDSKREGLLQLRYGEDVEE